MGRRNTLLSKKDKLVGIPLVIIGLFLFFPCTHLVNDIHMRVVYGSEEVNTNNLKVTGSSQRGLHISNGDILDGRQVTMNFIALSLTWLLLTMGVYSAVVNTLIRSRMPKIYAEMMEGKLE